MDLLVADRLNLQPADSTQVGLTPAELCERYGDRVYLFASMVSRGQLDADDIAQDALMRAINALPRFRPAGGGFEPWLWTIVVNVARRHRRLAFRRELVWEQLRHREKSAEIASADERVLARITDQQLISAVRALPPRSRAAIALRFGADLSFADTARHLGVTEAAAKMAVQRGLGLLRSRLQEDSIAT